MTRKKKAAPTMEFHTVKRIDNSRLARHIEPAKMRNLCRTAALGGVVALFFLFYIYQHFHCIDLSFQLQQMRNQQAQAAALNSELRLEIAALRSPRRIDVIARRQLGLNEPLPAQVQEGGGVNGAEMASVRYTRPGSGQ